MEYAIMFFVLVGVIGLVLGWLLSFWVGSLLGYALATAAYGTLFGLILGSRGVPAGQIPGVPYHTSRALGLILAPAVGYGAYRLVCHFGVIGVLAFAGVAAVVTFVAGTGRR